MSWKILLVRTQMMLLRDYTFTQSVQKWFLFCQLLSVNKIIHVNVWFCRASLATIFHVGISRVTLIVVKQNTLYLINHTMYVEFYYNKNTADFFWIIRDFSCTYATTTLSRILLGKSLRKQRPKMTCFWMLLMAVFAWLKSNHFRTLLLIFYSYMYKTLKFLIVFVTHIHEHKIHKFLIMGIPIYVVECLCWA